MTNTFQNANQDAAALAGLINNESGNVQTRTGGSKPVYSQVISDIQSNANQVIDDISQSRGFRVRGTFAAGFTYELPNDVGTDASGNPWILVDSSEGNLPFTVPAGTTPSLPVYQQVTFGDIDNISGLRNELDNRGLRVALSQAQTMNLSVGQYVTLTDLDGALSVVVSGSDTGGYYYATLPNGNRLRLVTDGENSILNFQSTADAVQNSAILTMPLGEFAFSSEIDIDGELQSIFGSSASFDTDVDTILTFSGNGIKLSDTASVNQSKIENFKIQGDGTGVGISKTTTSATSYTDSTLSNLRIQNFATGFSATYLWSTEFTNLRIQNCDQSFELLNQTNNLVFNNLNATGGTTSSRLINCEGCVMNGANISNQSGAYAFTMFQSYLVINSPYFENISNDLVLLGSSSESNPSSLTINGGLLGGDVVIGGNGCFLEINGSRQTATPSTQIKSANVVPDRWVDMKVSYQYVGEQRSSVNPVPFLDVDRGRATFFSGSSGGSVRAVELTPDYYIMRQTANLNGITITTGLSVGQQYTLVLMVRKDLLDGSLSVRSGSRTLAIADSIIPDSSDDWVIRTLPFVPEATDLRFLYRGDLQIKRIAIYEGILNTSEAAENVPEKFFATGTSILTGSWPNGSRVYNENPSIDANNMILDGWYRINNAWENVYVSNVSPAT